MAPFEDSWVVGQFSAIPVGDHDLSIYIDPSPDGSTTDPLAIHTALASFGFTVHPADGEHMDMPEMDLRRKGPTTVIVTLVTHTGEGLLAYRAYVQFNNDEDQTFASDNAGGDKFENVTIDRTGPVTVWAIPIAGVAPSYADVLSGTSDYKVHDNHVYLRGEVHVETKEITAGTDDEAARQVSHEIKGDVAILKVVNLGGSETTSTSKTHTDHRSETWRVHYTTGGIKLQKGGTF